MTLAGQRSARNVEDTCPTHTHKAPACQTRHSSPARRTFSMWARKSSSWPAAAFSGRLPSWSGRYLREFRSLLERYQYRGDLYGHFGDGCVHTRIDFDFRSGAGVARYRSFVEAAADLVVRHGGSLSGEHGDGQARGELLPRMFGPELIDAFRAFKRIWDPDAKMNPGKKIDANRLDDNLRLGESYRPSRPVTHFAFTPDGGNFSRTALRCVGVGACRKTGAGTMCPSYMATRDEKHATRGRARLLFEMLQGDVIAGGWKDEHYWPRSHRRWPMRWRTRR
jgi:hypothetical protein